MKKEELLILKKKAKKKKPHFLRQEGHRRVKLEEKWRNPKGYHSKTRRKFRGKGKSPNPGYGSPRALKGLTLEGLNIVRVSNLNDLKKLDVKNDAIVIARVGQKKKVELLKRLLELKIKILNVLKPEEFVKKIEDEAMKKKEEKKSREDKKKKEKEERLKKAEEKKKKEEDKTEEEKQEEAKEEKKKVLEKKE
ncbi:MAG: 50S ribosomal protein L32e [Nanoarchaeota archaeon]|nr:50S ribosomal protein L32e [Nanoarchaeota archaeon]